MSSKVVQAVVVDKFGGYDNLKVKNVELPPLDGKIEVKVEYGGLNFADLYTRQGLMSDKKLPFVLGMECTGTITALGLEDTEFKVGQKVICYNHEGGLYCEIIRIEPKHCFPLPDDINFDVGASLFVNYLTAYFAIYDIGHLKENEKVLIMSCAGGVGCAATQLAKLTNGVKIYGSASEQKEEGAKANGVDIFFTNANFINQVNLHKYDLILCNQSGFMLEFLQTLLEPLGRLVILGANNLIQDEKKLSVYSLLKLWWHTKNITPVSLIMNNHVVGGLHLGILSENKREKVIKALKFIIENLNDGKLNPKIHCVYPLKDIVDATKVLAERKNIGKVLLKFE